MAVTNMTSKGQVTIPKRARDAIGLKPGGKVEVGVANGCVYVKPAGKISADDYMKRIEKVRGSFKSDLSTDEIMEFLRGD